MADVEQTREEETAPLSEPYTVFELVFWIVGIASIPLVPIIMIWLLTPQSGV